MIISKEWLQDNTAYKPNDIGLVCDMVKSKCVYTRGKTKYLNVPISFDTETSSFIDDNGEKTAIMYVWMLGICGLVIVGRTWDEWLYVYNYMVDFFRTYGNKRVLIIYVHNLSFDFQFIRKHHNFNRIFALSKYEPLYAQTNEGIEFRCSYLLSGYSLAKIGENLNYHKVQKLTGDLNYRQIRHTQTPLTDTEIMYCINDAKVVCAYIDELIQREGDITMLPLTKTGFVRRYCRNACFSDTNYKYLIRDLTLSPDEFILCKNAFQGGFTHSNPIKTGDVIKDVISMDITSSYPSVLFCEMFPMSKPEHVTINTISELKHYCKNYCCVFTIKIEDIKPRIWNDFYLSASKCVIHGKRVISNGRLVSADYIVTTITNVDYEIIEKTYKYDKNKISIGDFIYFRRDYLPTPFVKSLINLYQQKTQLKDVEGKEIEYAVVKENQNSFYGMTVTSPIRKVNDYDISLNEWLEPYEPELETAIERYNNSYNRFLYYPWGIFCTAYARRNIWYAIINCGDDYIYTDTDSVKYTNYEAHKQFFNDYNNHILEKHSRACKAHNIPFEMCTPKNIKGKVKPLGVFEIDAIYKQFKTEGAKRYMYETQDGKYGIVIAGLNKKTGMQYIKDHAKDSLFDEFQDGLTIPSMFSGRLTHTYIDVERRGEITDLYGNTAPYKELSAIHLQPATFTMGLAGEFTRFINGIKEGEYIE